MSNSIGLIESKGIVALIEAADVILKNSPVTILGIHKLENGLVSLAVSGNSDYVKAAIESGSEAGRRVGEIYASSVVDNPSKELLDLFSELFPSEKISKINQDKDPETNINSDDNIAEETSDNFVVAAKQVKTESKREKSKPLQVTKVTPIHKIKKTKDGSDKQNKPNTDESLDKKGKEIEEKNVQQEADKPLSTIERLRLEALGLENKNRKSKESLLDSKRNDDHIKNLNSNIEIKDVDFDAISKMNVHKLRHYAREFPNFPIKGREISRANRDQLVEWFKTINNN